MNAVQQAQQLANELHGARLFVSAETGNYLMEIQESKQTEAEKKIVYDEKKAFLLEEINGKNYIHIGFFNHLEKAKNFLKEYKIFQTEPSCLYKGKLYKIKLYDEIQSEIANKCKNADEFYTKMALVESAQFISS